MVTLAARLTHLRSVAKTATGQLELSATATHASLADRRSRGGHLIQQTNRSQPGASADELTQAHDLLLTVDALTTASV
jgi:hypothetical protein